MNLPLVDLQRQRHSIADELQPVIDAVLDHCHFVGGPEVGQFEEAFASLCGVVTASASATAPTPCSWRF